MSARPANKAAALASSIFADPVGFIKDTFGEEPLYDEQRELLEAPRDAREVYVPACHDCGKSWAAARLTYWWLAAHPNDSIVLTTSTTWTQVEVILWREIAAAYAKARVPLGGRPLTTKYDLGPKWYAIGLSTDEPWNIQGFHASNILVIIDEADGIPKDKWDAIEGLLTSANARLVAMGNPVDPRSEFKRRVDLAAANPRAKVIRIDADKIPNVREGRIIHPFLLTLDWVNDKKIKWGETSPQYLSRVKAMWPDEGHDVLIPLSWLVRAKGREVTRGMRVYGADVARFGRNRTVRTLMDGGMLEWQRATYKEDTMQTASRIFADVEQYGPASVAVDDGGVGGGVVDRLRQLGLVIRAVNFGSIAQDREQFANLGSELYWKVRKGFEDGKYGFAMADPRGVDDLIAELNRPSYEFDARGRIKVEKLGLRRGESEHRLTDEQRANLSPDLADSYVICANAGARFLSGIPRRAVSKIPHRMEN